ncbi:MAG: XRE family transcriptional regulator [Pygmaiobacter massiliensis]|nr:XRE family transcriptional regulator [Pygmaiobacter massiliensis]
MFKERLKELRRSRKLSQVALARELSITQQAVGKWETGRSQPDPDTLRRLADFFNTTTDYLLDRSEEMRPARVLPYTSSGEHPIPIIGTVRAGFGALALEEDCGVEYARVRDPENYFYLLVKGDSMEPRIQDGDLALVHKQNTLEDGDLGVLVYGDEGEGTLKKFIRRGNAVVLQPFNPNYQPLVLVGEDLDRLYIAGKVVETKTKW